MRLKNEIRHMKNGIMNLVEAMNLDPEQALTVIDEASKQAEANYTKMQPDTLNS